MMRIQLTISLLVSDRIETLGKCLNSLRPLLRELDSELICVFTGKNDETLKLIQQYTAHIIPFSWCQDFAKARNAGLEHAKGEWFLYLDDDEWFDDTEEIIHFFKNGEYKSFRSAFYLQRNYADWEGKRYSDVSVGRMCRISQETRFSMPIHEYLEPFPKPRKDFHTFVHHFGYVEKAERVNFSSKTERNLPLLLKRLENGPEDDASHCCMQLAQEYASISKFDEAVKYCRKGLELAQKDNQIYSVEMWMQVHLPVLISHTGDYKDALEEGEHILNSARILDVTAVNLCATLVNICHEMREYKKGLQYVKYFRQKMEYLWKHPEITARQKGGDITFDFAEKRATLTYISGLVFAAEIGDFSFIKKLLTWIPWDDKVYVLPHYSHLEEWKAKYNKHRKIILECFTILNTNNPYVNLQKAYYAEEHDQLSETEHFWKICVSDCPTWLLWQPVQMAVRNQISLNNLIEQNSADKWDECVQALTDRISIPDMHSFYNNILPILKDYPLCAERLKQSFIEKQLSQGILESSQMLKLLQEYCESMITCTKALYSDDVLSGKNSYMLPAQCIFAFTIDRVFNLIERKEYADCIPLLREAFRIYPKLTAVISQLIRYLTEQIQAPPTVESEEFAFLGTQVKAALLGIMKKSQWEEAYGLIEQLLFLLPDDLEVLRMKQEVLRQGT